MHPVDCPGWDYEDYPKHKDFINRAVSYLLKELRSGNIDTLDSAKDTRPYHKMMFDALVPGEHPYFAGHYRGENFRCLRYYSVGVPGDPRVGTCATKVLSAMDRLADMIQKTISSLDSGNSLPDSQVSKQSKLYYTVCAACKIFEAMLKIHPYANGNGHAARLIVWLVLGRYNIWPTKWTIEPRPEIPNYGPYIARYRDGDKNSLERLVLGCCVNS